MQNTPRTQTYAAQRRLSHKRALGHIPAIPIQGALSCLHRVTLEHDVAQRGHRGAEMLALGMVPQRTLDLATPHVLDSGAVSTLSHMSRQSLTFSHTV